VTFRRGALVVLALATACERDALIGSDRAEDGGRAVVDASADTNSSSGGSANRTEAGSPPGDAHTPCVIVTCQGTVFQCGDCRDNDGDGIVDMADPDCLGPCHDAEDNFASPAHGNGPACDQDCYFDGNRGAGDDGCVWSHGCDPLSIAPDFPPESDKCEYDEGTLLPRGATCAEGLAAQSEQCTSACLPLTPNGCDCFGCCSVPGAATPIWLGSSDANGQSCDLAHVGDPTRCKPCTQVPSCLNPCETCERCIGKSTLPSSCSPGTGCPIPECVHGAPCGDSCLADCPSGQSCITGCCQANPR
jgi:hypothetical protein